MRNFPKKTRKAEIRLGKKAEKVKTITNNVTNIFDKELTQEMIKDGKSAYEIVGTIVSGAVDLSEDLIKANAVFTPASRASGKMLSVSHNYESGTATCAGSALLSAAAYRITVDKNKEVTGSQLLVRHVAVGKDAEIIDNSLRIDFDKDEDENKIEVVIVPYVRDSNAIDTPVYPANGSVPDSDYILVSGIVAGMKVTIEAVSKADLMMLD